LGEPGTGVLEVQKVAIESIWEFSEMSIGKTSDFFIFDKQQSIGQFDIQ
jgi:hypothetical protein